VALTASAATVTVGGTVDLSWTVSNATSCVASDGWSGARDPAGSGNTPFKTNVINTTTTFTLACTGDGGTTTKSVTVQTAAQDSGKKGGGGAVDTTLLIGLGLGLALGGWRPRRPRR